MRDFDAKLEKIAEDFACDMKTESAATLTTFKGGGFARVFYPNDLNRFAEVLNGLTSCGFKPFILGGGSNTIIADGYIKTPIVSTKRLKRIETYKEKVYAECGAKIAKVAEKFRQTGRGGFEFLSGVPATVGGAIRMNASAFGAETEDYICEITTLNVDCDSFEVVTLDKSQIDLGYRRGFDGVILGALLSPSGISAEQSRELANSYIAARRQKQPAKPSCGSVFKNGSEAAGKLIDECGLKGRACGGARISSMHGNFIVNDGGATAGDFISLVRLCEETVYKRFGIALEREFVYLK